ncbi:M3 family metallopeptidase [Fuerstiella marisgermanici]|uniref:oligopeptidase A n=1 Tax=Fuerstiella marisgermanici TaxID=1891926 RepID=A0A1P8WN30_9PLAN|nr:M3 family metallopeptidase [Fuerstiella marisgermanici]APZ95472.1 Oligopeptidase A [Fuerstiella marisgermanici]
MNSNNPLLQQSGLPAFDRIQPEHIEPAVTALLETSATLLEEAEGAEPGNWDALMAPLGKIDLLFEYGWSPVSHLLGVANSDELRDAHEAMLPGIVEFSLKLKQSKPLYERFLALRDSDAWAQMSSAQQRIVAQSILSAEQAGIALEGQSRQRFNEIAQRLSQLASDFSNNVLDATKAWYLDITDPADAEGLPGSFRKMAAAAWSSAEENKDAEAATPENGPWRVKLDAPSFGPFMEHCRNRSLREQAYRAYISRASSGEKNNEPLISKILQLRKEKCELLGYENYAELSLSQKMAADTAAVQKMFDDLLGASLEGGRAELIEITDLAHENGFDGELAHWDVGFWAERLREHRYNFTDEELRPYFSLERVLDGLFSLCHRLFGITVKPADGKAPVWHKDVRFFDVFNEQDQHIASFYLDPYSRPENKRGGAWMGDCIVRSVTPEETRLPVAHLVCNGTPPVGDTPSLMTFREVETLFHEFGHGLQHMLTTVDLRDASGINGVEWDAVELPSQFMENWCYHRPTLLGMAIHYETGEVLPDDLFEKICKARTFRAASQMLRQVQFGMTDMQLHSSFDPNGTESVFDVHQRIAEQTSPLPPLPENRFLCAFSHIFAGGYSAGYYSYKWAEVLSADAFSAFEDAGLDNDEAVATTGRRFRDTVLAEGGSRHPMDIYRDFRGREPNTEALLRHNGLVAS